MNINIVDMSFGFSSLPIFKHFNADIPSQKITCILGKSGCGKSTLLSLIAGTLQPQQGVIKKEHDRPVSFVYQDMRLIPHLTAQENILYVLPNSLSRQKKQALAKDYLQKMGLSLFTDFLPDALSGGMQRRISLARALAFPSDLILLDEAFDSLDEKTQLKVVTLFLDVIRAEKRTVICVTHHRHIAHRIADAVIELTKD